MMLETNDIMMPTSVQTPSPDVSGKRKRGRPKGSRNKPKEITQAAYTDAADEIQSESVVEFAIPKHVFDSMSGEQIINLLTVSATAVIRSGDKQPVVLKSVK